MEFNEIKTPDQLLSFMNDSVEYGFVDKNGKKYNDYNSDNWLDTCYVQTGEEVLKSRIGTCWDQVELERLWFEKNNYEIKTVFICFEVDYKNDYPTHTFLLYKKDTKWYWFENAFEKYRGIHEYNSFEEAIDYVISKYLEYAVNNGIAKKEDKKLISSYEYTKLNESVGVKEYIKHVVNKKI